MFNHTILKVEYIIIQQTRKKKYFDIVRSKTGLGITIRMVSSAKQLIYSKQTQTVCLDKGYLLF